MIRSSFFQIQHACLCEHDVDPELEYLDPVRSMSSSLACAAAQIYRMQCSRELEIRSRRGSKELLSS